jgi:hypothetical protein
MDHARIKWLQSELSHALSHLTGKEVVVSYHQAVYLATVVWPQREGSPARLISIN